MMREIACKQQNKRKRKARIESTTQTGGSSDESVSFPLPSKPSPWY